MSKKLEAWARADLVAEVLRLREDNEALTRKLEAAKAVPAKVSASNDLFAQMVGNVKSKPPKPRIDASVRDLSRIIVEDYDDNNVAIYDAAGLRETDLALLVRIGDDEVWFPKSTIHDDSEVYAPGHDGTLIVTTRMAEEKGLL
jgi:hypothetical protein